MSKDQLDKIVKEADASLELKLLQELRRRVETEWHGVRGLGPGTKAVLAALDEAGFIREDWGEQAGSADQVVAEVAPTLSDMVDAIEGLAGLKPALRRMAETLGCHHELLIKLEPHYPDPDGAEPAVADCEDAESCDDCATDCAPEPVPGRVSISREQWQALVDWADARCADGTPINELRRARIAAGDVCSQLRDMPPPKPSTVNPWCCLDRGCSKRDVPESGTAGEIWATYGTGPLPDPVPDNTEAVPDSKSGEPTPAAEEIARLTGECEQNREFIKQLQPLAAAGLKAKCWVLQGQEWSHPGRRGARYGLSGAIRLQAEWDQA